MSRLLPWIRLVAGLSYSFGFLVVLLALPFSAFEWMPLHSMLGGLFLELKPWAVFWITTAFFGASWSLMATTGLLTEGLVARKPESGPGNYLPEVATRLLRVPATSGQLALYSALAAVQALVVVLVSAEGTRMTAAFAALAGAVASYLVMVLLAVPVRLVMPEYEPLPAWRPVERIWAMFAPLRPLVAFLYRLASRVMHVLHLRSALIPGQRPPRLQGDHFYALTVVSGLLVLLAALGWLFFPPAERFDVQPPAGAYLYVLLLLVIWVLSGADFHFSRIHISPGLVLLLIAALVFAVTRIDHYYEAQAVAVDASAPPLTPEEVVRTSRAPENLVVVASAGGGILASGWTTLTLRHMLRERPRLADEIRLLTTVSGGSVGAAYYAHALLGVDDAERNGEGFDRALKEAFRRSTASSLDATAFGLAMLDFQRMFVGNVLPVLRDWDRGLLLENSWQRISGDRSTLFDLRRDIRQGRLPALILNSAVMERGHRLMLTQVDFSSARRPHARTQTELLRASPDEEVDVGLWTAARLSATFPYVSPAARSNLEAAAPPGGPGGRTAGDPDSELSKNRAYHMIDGGYYDNFGITSAIDWLGPVLDARLEETGRLTFKKVLILRLSAFPPSASPAPKRGLPSALAGPLLGLVALRTGTQVTRNEIDLANQLSSWQARFDQAGLGVCLGTLEIRPPAGSKEGPLSWHLTESQIEALEAMWPGVVPRWEEVRRFLESPDCPPSAL